MAKMKFKFEDSSIENTIEKLFLWTGAVFLFLGSSGLLLNILYPQMYGEDSVMQFATAFFNSYMMILGIFLIIYHGKIIVRGHRT
jgi:cytochrome b subunit of formate dehydrogenase